MDTAGFCIRGVVRLCREDNMRKCLLAAVVAATISIAYAESAFSQPPPLLRTWGSYGAGDGQFYTPVGLVVDPAGNAYVIDSNGYRVQKFSSSGSYLSQWSTAIGQPTGITADDVGNIIVSGTEGLIARYSTSGALLNQWASEATGIAANGLGNVYACTFRVRRITYSTGTGSVIATFGSAGSGPGQFAHPDGIAVSPGHVFVVDRDNHRIQKFTSTGTYVTQWGSFGQGEGQFRVPVRVAVDGRGIVYVVDNGNSRVQAFTSSGSYLTQWGSAGSAPGQFLNPIGIAVDAQGNVYVADTNNSRIQVFGQAPTPAHTTSWGRIKNIYR